MASVTALLKKFLMLTCYLLTQTVLTSEDVYEEFFKDKHLFDFSNIQRIQTFV